MLLFYDGYERTAEPTFAGRVLGGLRAEARTLKRTLRREQVLTGFGTWFEMLRRGLERVGVAVRVNDFAAARRDRGALIGAAGYPSVLAKLDGLPNPRILGPGLYVTPLENPTLFEDARNVSILLGCQWQEDIFRPWYGDRVGRWFGGFDLAEHQDATACDKDLDVLIYDKIYFDRETWCDAVLDPFRQMLDRSGLRHATVKYGDYYHKDYVQLLKRSRCMAFFAHSETQGMAYQECLSAGVPVFAWDEGVWPNPTAKDLGLGPIACTSVPYFSDQCGLTFKAQTLAPRWDEFLSRLSTYRPRQYVAEHLTLEQSATVYLDAWSRGLARLQDAPRHDVA